MQSEFVLVLWKLSEQVPGQSTRAEEITRKDFPAMESLDISKKFYEVQQFVIFDFRLKFYPNLLVLARFLLWNWQPIHFTLCEMSFLWLQIIITKYTGQ